jgi:N-glycosylase/DNA lyase
MRTEEKSKMPEISHLLILYKEFRDEIEKTLNSFGNLSEQDKFYELCYCLLTPANKAQNALVVCDYLKSQNFFQNNLSIAEILRGKPFTSLPHKIYIRFHNQKAERIARAKQNWSKIHEIINQPKSTRDKRDDLVQIVYGFGYKEASHFLRNIGHKGIAILDRHILRNLQSYGVIDRIPNISSRSNYLRVEELFIDFAKRISIPPESLDLLLWAKETGYVLK